MNRPVLGPVLVALSLATGALSCVLPDKEIVFEKTAITNRNAVRILESVLLSVEGETACDPNLDDDIPQVCPQPGESDPREASPHFLDPAYTEIDDFDNTITNPYAFCTCPEEQKDNKGFDLVLFVEDQDEDPRTREAKDKIFAALLLDLPQGTWYPYNFVDYLRYYDPERQLDRLDTPYKPAGRRDPQLRQLVVGGDQTGIDLCNGGRTRLSKGFHTLTVMVSDRAWFRPDGLARQVGVPDMDNGATYDSTHYVFSCDKAPANDDKHDCFKRCRPEKESS